jgi:choline dehydrogenase
VERHFDVLVLGGGTAGCVLGARLSEDAGRSVGLLEAGPDYGPYDAGRWPPDLLDARSLALESHCWETDRDDRSQLRARVLGGCSAHNACVVLRAPDEDYDEWGDGWRAAELRPHLDRAERQLGTRRLEHDELSPWHRAFVDAAGDEAIVHAVNAVGTVRWNAAFAYLDPARDRPNLTLVADTIVDRVLLEGERASGVTTSRGPFTADVLVLASGAYGSPGILLRSGFGPPVGDGLVDHPGVGLGWEPTEELRRELEAWERHHELFMAQVTVHGPSDTFLFPALEPECVISAAVFAMKPASRGSVRLTSRDPRAPLEIDHGFLSNPADIEPIAAAVERARELVAREPLRSFAGREERPGDTDLPGYVRENVRGFFHPVATCALGRATDHEARVQGIQNLYVGDASLMPTIPRVNTNLSTAAVAERVAELVSSRA